MGTGEFLSIDFFTALFTLGNTVILFLVLKKFLFKPVMKMIQDRQKEIDDIYADANQTKKEADDLQSQYSEKLSLATKTGEQMVKEAVERGQQYQAQILQQANAEADAIRQKAFSDIAREKEKALTAARTEIAGLAVEIAGKVIDESLTGDDREKLADRFIEALGEKQ